MKKTNRAILAALAVMVFSFSACAEEGEKALLIQEDVLVEQYEAEVEEITIDLPIDEWEGAVVEPQADEEACYYEDSEEETDSVPMDDSAALENEAVNAVKSESIIVLEETAEQMPEASEAGVEKVLIEEEQECIEITHSAPEIACIEAQKQGDTWLFEGISARFSWACQDAVSFECLILNANGDTVIHESTSSDEYRVSEKVLSAGVVYTLTITAKFSDGAIEQSELRFTVIEVQTVEDVEATTEVISKETQDEDAQEEAVAEETVSGVETDAVTEELAEIMDSDNTITEGTLAEASEATGEITDIEASTAADSEALVTEWEQAENADDTKDANDDGTASSKSGKMKSSKSKTSVDTDDSSAETSGNADESDEAVETTAIDTTASKSSKSSKSHSAKSSKATKTGFNAKSSSSAGSRSSQGKASTESGDADSQDDTSTLGIQLDGGESDYITVLSENTLRLTPSGDGMEWSVPSSAIETLQGDGITTLELVLDGEITTLEIAEAAQAVDSSEAEATAEKGKTVKQSAKKTEALTWIISDAGIVCEYGSLQLSWGAVSSIDYEAV